MTDPFEVLGIGRDATAEELSAAHRRLAQIYHPDRFVNSSPDVRAEGERRMADVNAAYDQLRSVVGWTVTYEAAEWTNDLKMFTTLLLLEAGIDHAWRQGELEVDRKDEANTDKIIAIAPRLLEESE